MSVEQETLGFGVQAAQRAVESKEAEREGAAGEEALPLRPHHLLCTQGYSGKGYDEAFVQHMNQVVAYLRNDPEARIRLTFSTDAICSACPRRLGEDLCRDQKKVKAFDSRLTEAFGLQERVYRYRELVQSIDANMTETMLCHICEGCGWYPVSACRSKICKAKQSA